jgi:HSP20 family molecular chaperone IbpA
MNWSTQTLNFEKELEDLKNLFSKNSPKDVCLHHDEKETIIEMEMPGVEKEDATVEYHENILTVTGNRKDSSGKVIKTFKESFNCHNSYEIENINAVLKNGIMTINIPFKKKEENKFKIEVK